MSDTCRHTGHRPSERAKITAEEVTKIELEHARCISDDDASRKLSMGMPALWSGFGSKKKKPAATDDVDDDAEEAPAMAMER